MHKQKRKGLFQSVHPLILASSSPRRRELMDALGIDYKVHPSAHEEPPPLPGEPPEKYASRNALAKALDVAHLFPDAVILGADTIVVLDGEILGKPRDSDHAFSMLTRLSGREHEVITACAVLSPRKGRPLEFCVTTKVFISLVPEELIRGYVSTGEPLDKAGSYAIQGIGAFMVERIEGSYTNVVGLPMSHLLDVLKRHGMIYVKGAESDVDVS